MSQKKKSLGRRTFLVGLFTGAGVAAAVGAVPQKRRKPPPWKKRTETTGVVLYRRSKEAERYYKTLYT
jgi:hypothetical protein